MSGRGRLLITVVVVNMVVNLVLAQQKTSTAAPKPGVVSGRIFAITGSGDIKPARMANVYLLYINGLVMLKDDVNSAGMRWLREETEALKEDNARAEADLMANAKLPFRERRRVSESLRCREDLLIYHKALEGTLRWAVDQNKQSQILLADADEEGNFNMPVAQPGIYTLLVFGRAGLNEALWELGDVKVAPGLETRLKVFAPKKSCLVIE